MRRLFQYVWAALAGAFLGGLFAESGQLLELLLELLKGGRHGMLGSWVPGPKFRASSHRFSAEP